MAVGSVPLRITIPDLTALVGRFETMPDYASTLIKKTLEKAAIDTQRIVIAQAPAKSGHLRQSIRYLVSNTENKATVFVDPKVKYAESIEKGSGVYSKRGTRITVPPVKMVMATKINPGWGTANSADYYIIGTSQSGQKPNPFMTRSRVLAWPIVQMTFKEARQLLISKLAAK